MLGTQLTLAIPINSASGGGGTESVKPSYLGTKSRIYDLIAPSSAYFGKFQIYSSRNSHLVGRTSLKTIRRSIYRNTQKNGANIMISIFLSSICAYIYSS